MTLVGYATSHTTQKGIGSKQGVFFERRRSLYPDGPLVSLVGFGGYRIGLSPSLGHPECREALEYALTRGVNLIDTSSNYGNGQSELLVGQVVSKLSNDSKLSRDNIVLVTKAGYVQGNTLEQVQQREREGHSYDALFKFGADLWYCLDPEFICEQIERSRARLGVECLDVFLIHNPEYMLKAYEYNNLPVEEAQAAFYAQIQKCFSALEMLVEKGQLRAYGVSSNTLGASSEDPTAVSLSRLLGAARAVKTDNAFRVVQCPLNWIEVSPIAVETADADENTLTLAQKNGIGVLVNRPFNAMHDGGLIRLTRPTVEMSQIADEAQRKGFENWSRLSADLEKLAQEQITTPGYEDATLSQLVLATLMWQPGVSSVLCGMRKMAYVKDSEQSAALPVLLNADDIVAKIYQDLEFHREAN